MDQSSETLGRSIAESLKKVNRARRIRAIVALALGTVFFLYSFLPVLLNAIAGASSTPHRAITGAFSILALGYGVALLVFGVRARVFFDRRVQTSISRRVIYFALLVGFLFLMDYLLTVFLMFLGRELIGRSN